MGQQAPAGQLGLLGRAPSFRLLFFSTLGSSLGTLIAVVALTVDVQQRTHSGAWVAALNIADFLPAVLIGLLLGPFVDRFSRRGLMVVSDLVRAAVFCVLPFAQSAGAIVALAGVVGFATGFFRPSVYAGLPNLVTEEDLTAANSLLQGIENLAWTAGPVAGGVITAALGPHTAYWINAATFLFSALLVARIPDRLLQVEAAVSKGHWRDVAEGWRLVRESRPLLAVLVAWSIALVGNAAVNVGEIFLAKDTFSAGDFGYGLLFGSIGLGLAVGSLGAAKVLERRSIASVYGGALALMGLGFAGAAVSPNVWVAAGCCAVAGVGNGAAGVCNATLVQRGAPDALRGRAFTLIMSVNFIALGLAMAVAGPVLDHVGPRWLWVGAGVVFGLAAVTGWTLARGVRAGAAVELVVAAEPVPPEVDPTLQRTKLGL